MELSKIFGNKYVGINIFEIDSLENYLSGKYSEAKINFIFSFIVLLIIYILIFIYGGRYFILLSSIIFIILIIITLSYNFIIIPMMAKKEYIRLDQSINSVMKNQKFTREQAITYLRDQENIRLNRTINVNTHKSGVNLSVTPDQISRLASGVGRYLSS